MITGAKQKKAVVYVPSIKQGFKVFRAIIQPKGFMVRKKNIGEQWARGEPHRQFAQRAGR